MRLKTRGGSWAEQAAAPDGDTPHLTAEKRIDVVLKHTRIFLVVALAVVVAVIVAVVVAAVAALIDYSLESVTPG